MREMRNGVIVEKSVEGCRVEGYLNDDRIIAITNFNITRCFMVSQSKALAGGLDNALEYNKIMTAALEMVESLRAECEGRVTIGLIERDGEWIITSDGFDIGKETSQEDGVATAKYFKQAYESKGVIVSYSVEE